MLPVLAAGFVFGAGTVLGVKYAEEILIPAASAFMEGFLEECDKILDKDATETEEK